MSSESYRSTGTIRVRFERKNANCQEWATKIFFTPNADSTVRDGGENYAMFIGGGGDDDCRKSKLPDSGEGIRIEVTGHHPGLVAAATQQTLVEVEVKTGWALRAITIPATGKKK